MSESHPTGVWIPGDRPPVCCRRGCDAKSTRRVILLDPDGTPEPLGHDDYCRRHARDLASGLKHYGPGRPGFRVETIT